VSAVDPSGSTTNYATGAMYAAHGAVTSMVYGQGGGFGGITSTSTFTNRLQPNTLLVSSSNGTVLNFTYCFNATVSDFAQACTIAPVVNNGNVARIANNLNTNRSQRFTYDELNRIRTALTQATVAPHAWGLSFGYDVWANLLSATVTQGNPPALSVAVTTKNQITGYCYDAAGNLIIQGACGPALVYQYDAENRMTTTAGVTYTYDGDGKRVKKSNGKLYWYGTSSDSLVETDLAGNNATDFVFFSGKRIARRDPAGTISYFFSDHLGSSRVVTNATGTIVEDSDFYPFGGERVVVDALNNQYKFTGKERDTESNLDFFGARYYSPGLGRFTSADDPFADQKEEEPQSWNLYTYVQNNPLVHVDPTGRGVVGKIVKFIAKGGDVAATVADVVDNAKTLVSPTSSTKDKVIAGASLLSELLPVSAGDAKAAYKGAKELAQKAGQRADDVADTAKATNKTPNPYGSPGKPDHQASVELEKQAAQTRAAPGEEVLVNKQVKGVDSKRRPDVQIVGTDSKTREIVEVHRKPGDRYDVKRKEEYDRLGIPNETRNISRTTPAS